MDRHRLHRPWCVRIVLAALLLLNACADGGPTREEFSQIELQPTLGSTTTFDPASVPVGESVDLRFDIINTGEGTLSVDALAFAGDEHFTCRYGADVPCENATNFPFLVAGLNSEDEAADRLPVTIRFTRSEASTAAAELVVLSDSREDERLVLHFATGEGVPRLQASPERVEFADVAAGDTARRTVGIVNTGAAELIIDAFQFDADAAFSLRVDETDYLSTEATRAGVTLDPPIVLAPDTSTTLAIDYTPEDREAATGTLQLHAETPEGDWHTVTIEALPPSIVLTLSPELIEFGGQGVGDTAIRELRLSSNGTQPLTIERLAIDEARSSEDFALDLREHTLPLVIPANDSVAVRVSYTPAEVSERDPVTGAPALDEGVLVIESDAFEPLREVPLSGFGADVTCPTAVIRVEEGEEVTTQTTLHLRGDESWATVGEIRLWEWTVTQPVGSRSSFQPSPTFHSPTFDANVLGTYEFCLNVWDSEGEESCVPACKTVIVNSNEALHVELLWETPGDPDETDTGAYAGADLDLHFLHPNAPSSADAPDLDGDGQPDPYFDVPYDCYWFNPHPDWASFGVSTDDPGLDRDDTDGAGPENMNLDVPENDTRYEVAVHYWRDHGYGPSYATVRVYIYDELVYQESNVRLINYDLWCVAYIDWPSGTITPCTDDQGGRRITPNYQHPMFFE